VKFSDGIRLGPYEITAPLGVGGMGEVYRARDTRLDRAVAIKVITSDIAIDADLRGRFEREARAVAALDHPHICGIYDVGEFNGTHFIVMPYLEGQTLAARLEKGPLPLDQVLAIAVQIADALDKAHRQGITHRDIKPANIMLTKAGAKLLDFGLAKLKVPDSPVSISGVTRLATAAPATAKGTILGTVQYMSPEQLEGKEADSRSDIWALGTVMFEMATGARPFKGDTPASVIGAIFKDEPPLISTLRPLSPPAFDRVVSLCLVKDPEDRWQSAKDLTTELRWVGQGDSGSPTTKNSRGKLAWSVAAVLLLVTMALVFRLGGLQPIAAEPVQFVVLPPEGGTLTGDGLAGSNPPSPQVAIAPDGRHLAFIASTADGRPRLWIRSFDTITARVLAGTEGAARPFWSPDSRSIGFFAGAKLKTIAATGGPVQVLCEAPTPRGGTWNQSGTIIFARGFGGALYRVSAAGGQPVPITRIDVARQELSHRWPEFLPDGRHFLYLVINARRDQSGIYLGTLDTQESVRLIDSEFRAGFAPPGYLLFVREGTLLAQPFDVTTLKMTGESVAVTEHVGFGPATGEASFSTSANGLAYTGSIGSPLTQLTWFDRVGQRLSVIGTPAEYENVSLSSDNGRIAVQRVDATLGTEVWLVDSSRGTTTRFTFDPAIDFSPTWSPDSSRIVFSSNRGGTTFDLFQKLSSGASREELLLKTGSNGVFPTSWSSDGGFLLYNTAGNAGFDMWVLPFVGERKPFLFLDSIANETQARFSRDRRWVAYTSDETGAAEVFVQPFPATGAKWQVSTGGGSDPQWRRDGGELFYVATDGKLMAAPINGGASTFEAGTPQALFQTHRPTIRGPLFFGNYAPAADGQRFLVNTIAVDVPPTAISVALNWTVALKR